MSIESRVEAVLRHYCEDEPADPYLYLQRVLIPSVVKDIVEAVGGEQG